MSIFSSTNFSSAPMTDPLSSLQGATSLLGPNFSSAPITAPLNSLQAATTLFGPDVSSPPITAPLNMFEASMLYPNGQNLGSPAMDVSDDMDVPLPDINDPDNAASQSADAVLNYFEKKNIDEQNAEIQSAQSEALRRAGQYTTHEPLNYLSNTVIKITGARLAVASGLGIFHPNQMGNLFIPVKVGMRNQHVIINSASDGKIYNLMFDFTNAGIKFSSIQLPLGSWLIDHSVIHLATKKEASLAALSHSWAKNNPYLNHLFSPQNKYKKSSWNAINYFFNAAMNGAKLLPNLVSYVSAAARLSKKTFWAAMNRLVLLKRLQVIEGQIKREANWQYKPGNVFLNANFTGGKNLTFGTAALSGFLLRIQEITRMGGFNVKTSAGKLLKNDKSFVDLVRTKIFLLGNTLNTKSYKGNSKGAIQNSVRRAAASGNIDHIFDGKNDPVLHQGKISNRRELQVDRELIRPDFPWVNPTIVREQQTHLDRLVGIARHQGYASTVNRAFEAEWLRGGMGETVTTVERNRILQTAGQDIQNYDFGQLIMDMMIHVPGAFFDVERYVVEDNFAGWRPMTNMELLRDVINEVDGRADAIRRMFNGYRDEQTDNNLNNILRLFEPGRLIDTTYNRRRNPHFLQHGDTRVVIGNRQNITEIINTLLVGGTALQGTNIDDVAEDLIQNAVAAHEATAALTLRSFEARCDLIGNSILSHYRRRP